MKKLMLASAALTALASPTFAGGPLVVSEDPVAAYDPEPVNSAVDWSGAYAGLSYGRTSGDITDTSSEYDFDRGTAVGAFVGYNLQRGNLVYGGELAYSKVSDMTILDGTGDDTIDSLLDLRARLGFAAGKALLYGAVGYSRGELTFNGGDSFTLSGTSLGLGVDYLVTNSLFVGLDYTSRKLEGTVGTGLGSFESDGRVNTLGLRVGFNF